ncbi:mixed lineage kinase domain-like protein [Cottoperca gobio]|uniref:Mixed lineage kinase domain-like protein n=1 Tax=Cottoperca gobio TaxID=56716 RepID=A0A6J2PWU9_COTGO|nr:mixed lineage kinase domain-like protein [Cottoperca gobio]XP_029290598.1 mixed lineage kinase domain-like protein [Cottoperca gobio]
MDTIEAIVSIAAEIYTIVENVKANKKRCHRVCYRVKALEDLLQSIKKMKQISDEVKKTLGELSLTLISAKELIEKYSRDTWYKLILKNSSYQDEFNCVNDRLTDAFQSLSGALQVEQGNVLQKVFEQGSRKDEDEVDRNEDDNKLKNSLQQYIEDKEKELKDLKIKVEKVLDVLKKPSIINEKIRMIKQEELEYKPKDGISKTPFMTTSTSEVYRGEFCGFPVAIKRYFDPVTTDLRKVERIFNKEVKTMKRFESPNILRMFGICRQDRPSPQFLIIMEYCEKGSLRQVLDSGCTLTWITKACMCRDAARGLYRLHHTEVKSNVHGCINSSKFLVAKDNTVKLGGFELTETETSLRKTKEVKVIRSMSYSSPEMLADINKMYCKECEIYSFGIVLWEVATGHKPFDGLSNKEIDQKVNKEKFQEPLPDDCPKELGDLINACRAYDPFHRPSAGVLLDKLQSVVTQLEK